jgi:hypothetical protein
VIETSFVERWEKEYRRIDADAYLTPQWGNEAVFVSGNHASRTLD